MPKPHNMIPINLKRLAHPKLTIQHYRRGRLNFGSLEEHLWSVTEWHQNPPKLLKKGTS